MTFIFFENEIDVTQHTMFFSYSILKFKLVVSSLNVAISLIPKSSNATLHTYIKEIFLKEKTTKTKTTRNRKIDQSNKRFRGKTH